MISFELEIKKSKFIGFAFTINSSDEVNCFLEKLKKDYKKATHICFAYRLNNNRIESVKFFDDGEPSGTAGRPILNVLEKNKLFNYAIIVIRYFGGIKLGAGGLVRAYSKCASELVKLIK